MKIKKSSILNVFEVFITAIVVNPIIYNSNASFQRYIQYIALLMYMLINNRVLFELINIIKRKLGLFFVGFVFWFVWALQVPIIHGTLEFSFINNFWYGLSSLLYILALAVYVLKHTDKHLALEKFCYIYSRSMAIYVIFTIILLLVPKLREIIVNYFVISEWDRKLLSYKQYYTRIGWSGFAAYGTSLKCTIAFAFSMSLLFNRDKKNMKKYQLIGIALLLFAGNLLYARTGLIVCVVIVLIYILNIAKYKNRLKEVIGFGGAILILCLIFMRIILKHRNNSAMAWIFEAVYNYLETGSFTTQSTNVLTGTMLFVPKISTFLFGDGFYKMDDAYYMHTDLGFMRLLLYGGVFFAIYIYLWMYHLVKKIIKKNSKWMLLVSNVLIAFVLFEIKGEATITIIPMVIILASLALIGIDNGEKMKCE